MIGHLFLVDFITDLRLRKKGIFPNLMWMAKNLDFQVWKFGYVCGRC